MVLSGGAITWLDDVCLLTDCIGDDWCFSVDRLVRLVLLAFPPIPLRILHYTPLPMNLVSSPLDFPLPSLPSQVPSRFKSCSSSQCPLSPSSFHLFVYDPFQLAFYSFRVCLRIHDTHLRANYFVLCGTGTVRVRYGYGTGTVAVHCGAVALRFNL